MHVSFKLLVWCLVESLTANKHDADGENLLHIGVWRDVPKSDTGETAEGEIKRGDVFILSGGSGADITVVIMLSQLIGQIIQPTRLHVRPLHVANGVPDAGQPMSDKHKGTHEQEQNCSSILRISIQFPGHTDQSQQPGGLQQANESGCRLQNG